MRAPKKAMVTGQPLPCRYCECGTQIYTYFRAVGSYFLCPPYYKHGTSVFEKNSKNGPSSFKPFSQIWQWENYQCQRHLSILVPCHAIGPSATAFFIFLIFRIENFLIRVMWTNWGLHWFCLPKPNFLQFFWISHQRSGHNEEYFEMPWPCEYSGGKGGSREEYSQTAWALHPLS